MRDVISGHAKDRRKAMPDAKMQRDLGIVPSRRSAARMSVGRGEACLGGQDSRAAEGTSR